MQRYNKMERLFRFTTIDYTIKLVILTKDTPCFNIFNLAGLLYCVQFENIRQFQENNSSKGQRRWLPRHRETGVGPAARSAG
jgi:hypothetical protein